MIQHIRLAIYLFLLAAMPWNVLIGQPGTSIDLPKPKKFENRTLASEKSTTTKMNVAKKFSQNINTRYNFQFNAGNELNEVVIGAKQSFKDDFSKLLPFYNYSLENTLGQKNELDSVIHKCNNGILLHDLRNDWIDDLYLLMGKAYFYQKNFDSAAITFQYINFAFQPRTKDEIGYDKYIGSNQNTDGNVYTIATKEKENIVSRVVSHTPARNDAIIWLVRTLIALERQNEAWGLMATLRRDPAMPKRLEADLNEMFALWFYQAEQFDSAAIHLENALPAAGNLLERSRWEYLSAQLYERAGKKEDADRMFDRCINHTTDPVMEAYARISQIRLVAGDDEEKRIRMNLDALLDMAKKAKYEEYRHIIYYAAAQLEISRHQPAEAVSLYKKSLETNTSDPDLKNQAFLELGNLAFDQKIYPLAYTSYDSVTVNEEDPTQLELINTRRTILGELLAHMENIRVEDSLQKIADMPEEQRNSYLKGMVKKLRKEKGLKEEEASTGSVAGARANNQDNVAVDLFAANDSKGEWYFYNTSLKAQGFKQFQATWGKRPNLDNWRRMTAVNNQLTAKTRESRAPEAGPAIPLTNSKAQPADISMEGLKANLPMTAELRELSNDTIQQSLYLMSKIFQDKLGDCDETIRYFEQLLNRFPTSKYQEEALFGLCYCYQKAGNTAKVNFYKGYLSRNFSQSKYLRYLNNPTLVTDEKESFSKEATKKYEGIYTLFIEGKFDEALKQKRKADSTYGENFWSPQLLYIESIYYIKQKQDSLALSTLNNILVLYPQSPLGPKVGTLMDVLSRRKEIEAHLDTLKVTRYPEDSFVVIAETAPVREKEKVAPREKPLVTEVKPIEPIKPKTDTAALKAPVLAEKKAKGYFFDPKEQHMVVLVLDKVDVVYINEARIALSRYNKEKYYNQPLEVITVPLNDNIKLVQIKSFSDAVAALGYLEKTRSVASTEIFSWLPADKYSFILLTESNLEVLMEQKKMDAYLKFLKESIPGKF